MSKTLEDVAQELRSNNKKTQLIYAFNGTGKTRLSKLFKNLVVPRELSSNKDIPPTRNKILYYNAFTEDLFYWDNDLTQDIDLKLKIQPNTFTQWILSEQGKGNEIIGNFQRYTNEKLNPKFNDSFDEVTFSFARGNDEVEENIKISKGEESNFIWCIFYSLLEQVIDELNIPDYKDRSSNQFDDLEYIFIDDPVSSLDENHLIELAVDIATLIKSSQSSLKFIITTHNPLFYNVLHNELGKAEKYILKKHDDGMYALQRQDNDSPFSYHLHLKLEIENAIKENNLQKYHFNFLRNILEKTSTFLGYKKWDMLLPILDDGERNPYEKRITDISSHSKHSTEEIAELTENDKKVLKYLIEQINETYHFKQSDI